MPDDSSYLRREDRVIIEFLSNFSICWTSGKSIEAPSDESAVSIAVAAEHSLASICRNHRPVVTRYHEQEKFLRFNVRSEMEGLGILR